MKKRRVLEVSPVGKKGFGGLGLKDLDVQAFRVREQPFLWTFKLVRVEVLVLVSWTSSRCPDVWGDLVSTVA